MLFAKARACIDTAKCKACPVCNGLACRNTIPGPGAKGVGSTAIRNYQKWQDIRVQMDTLHENKPVDMSVQLFGRKFSLPFFAGPVGAIGLHYGNAYDELTYNKILVSSCAENGIAAFTATVWTAVSWQRRRRLSKLLTAGYTYCQPWNLETIKESWPW